MDREKAIEEMAMLLCKDMCHKKVCATAGRCALKNCIIREKAALLYGFVVRQINSFIPCGAVVLTREQQIADIKANTIFVDKERENARKEKAGEILDDIFSDAYSIGGGLYELTPKDKRLLYKQYGVEV